MGPDKQQLLRRYLASLALVHKDFSINEMRLHDKSPYPLKYVHTNHLTPNTHDGQMKLLLADEMSVMLGLLHICSKSKKELHDLRRYEGAAKVAVVVAGAAPGDHFLDLSATFALVDLHLYDPAPRGWHPDLEARVRRSSCSGHRVSLYTQRFTLETAKEWRSKKGYEHVIFLSDFRSGQGPYPSDGSIAVDMEAQRQMVIAMNACYSVVKFRPGYFDETDPKSEYHRTLKYFDGTIYLQGYPPVASTETRLHITDTSSVKYYDTEVYQNQLFYHNQVTRNQAKVLFGPEKLGYDNAYARFVEGFLLQYMPSISAMEHDWRGRRRFDHERLRVLLAELALPCQCEL
jgi:hypothetical protein